MIMVALYEIKNGFLGTIDEVAEIVPPGRLDLYSTAQDGPWQGSQVGW